MSLALFNEFPILKNHVPHISFSQLPTPLVDTELRFNDGKIRGLSIKQDNISHMEYGGNKVRKLEFIIAEALAKQKSEIITFGAIGTNHGVATALFCKKHNIKCTVILFDQPFTETVRLNLAAMISLGANLIYKGSLFKAASYFFYLRAFARRNQYFLTAGGSNVAGCIAFINASFELKNQLNEANMQNFDYIYCPVGSSATLAGLTLGCSLAKLSTKVIGVRVAPSHLGPIPICTQKTVTKLMKQTLCFLRQVDTSFKDASLPLINLNNAQFGAGYGESTDASLQAKQVFADANIHLENTYTSKAAAATLEKIVEKPEKRVLFWNTFSSADINNLIHAPINSKSINELLISVTR